MYIGIFSGWRGPFCWPMVWKAEMQLHNEWNSRAVGAGVEAKRVLSLGQAVAEYMILWYLLLYLAPFLYGWAGLPPAFV